MNRSGFRSIEAVVGAPLGGSADSLYDGMLHSNWTDSTYGFFGSTSYPRKESGASASFAPIPVPMSHAVFALGIGGRW
jgi:hypothetical protein